MHVSHLVCKIPMFSIHLVASTCLPKPIVDMVLFFKTFAIILFSLTYLFCTHFRHKRFYVRIKCILQEWLCMECYTNYALSQCYWYEICIIGTNCCLKNLPEQKKKKKKLDFMRKFCWFIELIRNCFANASNKTQ